MSRLKITFAGGEYEHLRAMADGYVKPEGIDLNFITLKQGAEVNFRMLRNREFDVSELSMGSYVRSLFEEDPPFVAIPVFPFRMFRHSCIFINEKSGIKKPNDLVSKRVGNPRFQQTTVVWIRGILADRYDLPVSSVSYYQGGEEEPGRWEGLPLDLSKRGIKLQTAKGSLSSLLEKGEIEAIYSSRIPSSFDDPSKGIKRMFPDYVNEEKKYFKDTGIYPIMHAVVIRRDVYKENPWIAMSLYKALSESKKKAYDDYHSVKGLPGSKFNIPWMSSYIDGIRDLMGWDFAPYGLEPNRKALETFLRYCYDQGIAERLLKPEEIFAAETLEQFKV